MKNALFLLLPLLFVLPAHAQKTELFILSIGVEKYVDPDVRTLSYCAEDARDVAEAFRQQTDLYDVVEVKVLVDSQATRLAVSKELDRIAGQVTANDMVIFFFSGHGIDKGLVPYDFNNSDRFATALTKDALESKFAKMGCNYMVFIDACHSGLFAKSLDGKDLEDDKFALTVEQASRQLADALSSTDKQTMVIASSSSDQISWEWHEYRHGYFAQTLLDCINGKSVTDKTTNRTYKPQAEPNGFLSASALEAYMMEAVRIHTRGGEAPQQVRIKRSMGGVFPVLRLENSRGSDLQQQQNSLAPDRDHDGFPDTSDECPTEYGTLRGCPDSDRDGIADHKDDCPDEYGPASNNGCPVRDRDGDGVVDAVDKCPDKPGAKDWQGCPDSDNDGIPDHRDECPEQAGVAAKKGCPDVTNAGFVTNAETITDATVGTFVKVKGGSFDMGSENGESDEKPVHRVTLNDYYLGQTEVTQAQWKAVMGNNPSYFSGCDKCPVEKVNWDDIQTFLQKLNSRSGGVKYRLPTEAEWEYAARGGTRSKGYTYAGSNNIDDVAWYDTNSGDETHKVKDKQPNELGLYDMTGNVWEWCSDWYDNYSSGSQTNLTGATSGSDRVYRGGSWVSNPQNCRVANRSYITPDNRYYHLSFRLARAVSF